MCTRVPLFLYVYQRSIFATTSTTALNRGLQLKDNIRKGKIVFVHGTEYSISYPTERKSRFSLAKQALSCLINTAIFGTQASILCIEKHSVNLVMGTGGNGKRIILVYPRLQQFEFAFHPFQHVNYFSKKIDNIFN